VGTAIAAAERDWHREIQRRRQSALIGVTDDRGLETCPNADGLNADGLQLVAFGGEIAVRVL
jgi:hypothetical protein